MSSAEQDVLNGPHTRVRVDAAVMPTAPPMVSPQGKGKKKASAMRQMGLGNFYKGIDLCGLSDQWCMICHLECLREGAHAQASLSLCGGPGWSVRVLIVQAH